MAGQVRRACKRVWAAQLANPALWQPFSELAVPRHTPCSLWCSACLAAGCAALASEPRAAARRAATARRLAAIACLRRLRGGCRAEDSAACPEHVPLACLQEEVEAIIIVDLKFSCQADLEEVSGRSSVAPPPPAASTPSPTVSLRPIAPVHAQIEAAFAPLAAHVTANEEGALMYEWAVSVSDPLKARGCWRAGGLGGCGCITQSRARPRVPGSNVPGGSAAEGHASARPRPTSSLACAPSALLCAALQAVIVERYVSHSYIEAVHMASAPFKAFFAAYMVRP